MSVKDKLFRLNNQILVVQQTPGDFAQRIHLFFNTLRRTGGGGLNGRTVTRGADLQTFQVWKTWKVYSGAGVLFGQAILGRRLQREAQRQQRQNKKPAKVELGGLLLIFETPITNRR